jgi:hypothetical protein
MGTLPLVGQNILGSSLFNLVLCVSLVKEINIYIVAAKDKKLTVQINVVLIITKNMAFFRQPFTFKRDRIAIFGST